MRPEAEAQKGRTLILLANEPRAYREVIASTVRSLRPGIEVLEALPESLEISLESFTPDMVVCSAATDAARDIPVWVELYPEHGALSVASVAGRRWEIEDIELQELLDLVDQADGIAQHS